LQTSQATKIPPGYVGLYCPEPPDAAAKITADVDVNNEAGLRWRSIVLHLRSADKQGSAEVGVKIWGSPPSGLETPGWGLTFRVLAMDRAREALGRMVTTPGLLRSVSRWVP
jgi:hypothetical protein